MIRKLILILGAAIMLAACANNADNPLPSTAPEMSNPASDYCVQQGYTLEITTAEDGSQSGICIFSDGSSCDEWAFFRGECGPATPEEQPEKTEAAVPSSTPSQPEFPVQPTINPADYQGWWTYTNPLYNFSLLVPEDWVVEAISTSEPLLSGHMIKIHPRGDTDPKALWVTYRIKGEDILLWPTGVAEGEFVLQGTLDIAGEPALRYLLVCPSGEVTSIWYHQSPDIAAVTRGDLEFGFFFCASRNSCEPGQSLEGKNQLIGEMIIASLSLQ
jgi:putative hemolysin